MAKPSISFKSFGYFRPGEKSLLLGMVNLSDPDGGTDIDAVWFRDDSSGGGYIEVGGRVVPAGYTAGFHRDTSVSVGSREIKFSLSDLSKAYFVAGPVGSSDRLVANASDGVSTAGASYVTLRVGGSASNPPKISVSDATTTEGGTLAYKVTLDRAADKDFTLSYYTTTGSASQAAGDYYGTTGSSITIRKGDTSATINVRTIDDSRVEGTETTGLKLSGTTYGTIIDSTARGTIRDNDVASNPPKISVSDATTTEGGTLRFTVTLDKPANDEIEVHYQTLVGTASQANGDYFGTTGSSIKIPQGQTSAQIEIQTRKDGVIDATDTMSLKLISAGGATIIDSVGKGTILDDGVNSSNPTSDLGLTIPYPFDSELHGVRITQLPNGTYSHSGDFASGWDFALPRYSEVLAVADGTVVDLRESVGHRELGSSRMGNFITIQFNKGTADEFFATYLHLEKDSIPVSIGQSVNAGDVVGKIGWTGIMTGYHLHFQTSKELMVYGSGSADNIIYFAKGTSKYANLVSFDGSPTAANSAKPNFSISDASATEGEDLVFEVTSDIVLERDVVISYRTHALSASHSGKDYEGTLDGQVTMLAGTNKASIIVNTLADGEVENVEQMRLGISNVSYGKVTDKSAVGSITDNTTLKALPSVKIYDTISAEGQPLRFNVRLEEASDQDVEIFYTVAPITASFNDATIESGSITIPSGKLNGVISVRTNSDSDAEPNETVSVRLTNARGAEIAEATPATGTIVDNDDERSTLIAQYKSTLADVEFLADVSIGVYQETFEIADKARYNTNVPFTKIKLADNIKVLNFSAESIKSLKSKLFYLNAMKEGLEVYTEAYRSGISSDATVDEIGEAAAGLAAGAIITGVATAGVAIVAGLATGAGVTVGLPILATGIVVGGVISYLVQDELSETLEGYWDEYFADFVQDRLENAPEIIDKTIRWTGDKIVKARDFLIEKLPQWRDFFRSDNATEDANVIGGLSNKERIDALGGNDWIVHSGGSDDIDGGSGSDTMDYRDVDGRVIVDLNPVTGAGSVVQSGSAVIGGTELVSVLDSEVVVATDTLKNIENVAGSSGNDSILGSMEDNHIAAGLGDDFASGGGGHDRLSGSGGNDELIDGVGNDQISGDAGHDRGTALAGINEIDGGEDADLLIGGFQSDRIDGGSGDDLIKGDASRFLGGSDVLDGGTGDDLLMGGIGADTFVFTTNSGVDTIAGFDVAEVVFDQTNGYSGSPNGSDFQIGVDHAQLEGFSSVNASNVMSFVSDGSDGAVFNAEGTSILFYGISASSLSADDFIFV